MIWGNFASLRGRICSIFLFLLLFFSALPGFAQNPVQVSVQSAGIMNLSDALRILGSSGAGEAEILWDPFFSSGNITAGIHQASFSSGKAGEIGAVLFDYKEILNLPLPFRDNGALFFPEAFVGELAGVFRRYAEEDAHRFRIAAIIIDPGHGGKDPGAVGTHSIGGKSLRSVEKDITLKVSRQLHASLTAAFPDKRVLLTRNGDTFPSLEDRVSMANAVPISGNEAAIYISVHANASFNKTARGYEVWYLSPGYRRELIDKTTYTDSMEVLPILNSMLEEELTTESILMARSILKRLEETVGGQIPSRGLKAEEWFVVRNARMPSVLVELGFVTNETDASLMDDEAYLKKLSDALYKGISDFIAFFERSGGFTTLQ